MHETSTPVQHQAPNAQRLKRLIASQQCHEVVPEIKSCGRDGGFEYVEELETVFRYCLHALEKVGEAIPGEGASRCGSSHIKVRGDPLLLFLLSPPLLTGFFISWYFCL